ncbi:thyrostimulin alpha-2 subunit-like [Ptychodera flava]|uniref:thyrostimulin alpha-2 subunit-like n=1 Tax=Ptychodera flava TaxID=63121 RepID=UPI00396AA899
MKIQEIVGLTIIFILSVLIWRIECQPVPYWQQPGCHLVGYVKKVRVPECHEEQVRMNACRGYCTSYSYLSSPETLEASGGTHVFTAKGSCCTIERTHDVAVTLQCLNGRTYRDIFKSAASCVCGICDRD